MVKNKLTARQEKFCQSIADGKTQVDAYKSAYNTGKSKNSSLYVRASELLNNSKIIVRIDELKKALEKKHLWTRELSVQILGSIALGATTLDKNKIAAIKELNAMHGYNEPTKMELSVNPLVLILETDEGAN